MRPKFIDYGKKGIAKKKLDFTDILIHFGWILKIC